MKVQKFLTDDDEYGDEESDAAVTFADHPGPHQGWMCRCKMLVRTQRSSGEVTD